MFSLYNIKRYEYMKVSMFRYMLGFPHTEQRKTKGQTDGQLTQGKRGGIAIHLF